MKTNLSSLSLAYLTVERNPPPYYSGEKRLRENENPEFASLKKRLSSIGFVANWRMAVETPERIPGNFFGIQGIKPLKNVIVNTVRTKIIQPARALFTEFSIRHYLLMFAVSFICLGIMAVYSAW